MSLSTVLSLLSFAYRQVIRLAAASLLVAVAGIAHATNLPKDLRVPGGVAVIEVAPVESPRPSATRDGARVWVAKGTTHWMAIVGLPLATAPGDHSIDVTRDGKSDSIAFRVKPKKYAVQTLRLNKAMVDPPPEVMARIERESAHLKTVRNRWRDSDTTNARFILPANGRLSSRFGVARVLNGKPRAPHAGLDVAVGTGTPIVASGDGIVIDADDYYYCGKTMFVDHGNGLITMHCHLSEFVAKVGDHVKQGERIALSGGTGRATGPHLHWSVYLNGVSVEPELFIATK
ncbi:MAG: peptidoglycan DD-metalloendopeptidase family protein [Casimicrobium sp.]